MLRVSDPEAIRNPQLYFYTVASNLVKEHAPLERRHMAPPLPTSTGLILYLNIVAEPSQGRRRRMPGWGARVH